MVTAMARHSRPPAARPIAAPIRSVMPVADKPADNTNTAATMIAGSLENPDKAWVGVRMPVRVNASVASIATRSTRSFSLMNNTSATTRMTRNTSCCCSIPLTACDCTDLT